MHSDIIFHHLSFKTFYIRGDFGNACVSRDGFTVRDYERGSLLHTESERKFGVFGCVQLFEHDSGFFKHGNRDFAVGTGRRCEKYGSCRVLTDVFCRGSRFGAGTDFIRRAFVREFGGRNIIHLSVLEFLCLAVVPAILRTREAAAFQSGSFSPRNAWNTVPEV